MDSAVVVFGVFDWIRDCEVRENELPVLRTDGREALVDALSGDSEGGDVSNGNSAVDVLLTTGLNAEGNGFL